MVIELSLNSGKVSHSSEDKYSIVTMPVPTLYFELQR